jgi:hypothetical protein
MNSVQDVLTSIGYNLRDFGKSFRARPLYRDSGNSTSLVIDKDTGNWHDFSLNKGGDLKQLIKISLNLSSEDEVLKYLNGFTPSQNKPQARLEQPQIYPKDLLIKLRKDYSYWQSRGISQSTLELFDGGVADNGKMANRFVFPIYNSKDEIVGFSGRDLAAKSEFRPKWKHIGQKSLWCYPLKINKNIISSAREVILVESIGDLLALWEAGIKNVMCCFGVEVSAAIVSFLIKIDAQKIILAFNNEPDNDGIGNKAAEKALGRLMEHFDARQVTIHLPSKKDFGEMDYKEIIEWKNNL